MAPTPHKKITRSGRDYGGRVKHAKPLESKATRTTRNQQPGIVRYNLKSGGNGNVARTTYVLQVAEFTSKADFEEFQAYIHNEHAASLREATFYLTSLRNQFEQSNGRRLILPPPLTPTSIAFPDPVGEP